MNGRPGRMVPVPYSPVAGMPANSPALQGGGCQPVDPCQQAFFDQQARELPTSDVPPNVEPPIDARFLRVGPIRAVLNIPAAFDADANLAGLNLIAAEPFLTPTQYVLVGEAGATTPPFAPAVIVQQAAKAGHIMVIRWWGLTVNVGDPTAAKVLVNIGGPAAESSPPSPLVSTARFDEMERTGFIVPDGKAFSVSVQNLDSASPLFVTFAALGWVIPRKYVADDPRSLLRRLGFHKGA